MLLKPGLTLGKLRQEGCHKFEARLYSETLSQKTNEKMLKARRQPAGTELAGQAGVRFRAPAPMERPGRCSRSCHLALGRQNQRTSEKAGYADKSNTPYSTGSSQSGRGTRWTLNWSTLSRLWRRSRDPLVRSASLLLGPDLWITHTSRWHVVLIICSEFAWRVPASSSEPPPQPVFVGG